MVDDHSWNVTDDGYTSALRMIVEPAQAGTPWPWTLPLVSDGVYDFRVEWGDGTSDHITSHDDAAKNHNFTERRPHEVVVVGTIEGIKFPVGGTTRLAITEIKEWGPLKITGGSVFYNCGNLTITATDAPDISGTPTMAYMFYSCGSLTTVPGMNDWDVGHITSMSFAFSGCDDFNQDISDWNVENVTSFEETFRGCSKFNQDLSGWDMKSAKKIEGMFFDCTLFNQPIGSWNVSATTNFQSVLRNCDSFDQSLAGWNIEAATNLKWILLDSTGMSPANYNATLIAWEGQTVNNNISIDFGGSQYHSGDPADARQRLIDDHNWTISDGGEHVPAFRMLIETTSNNETFTLPLHHLSGPYNFNVDWGDSTSDTITAHNDAAKTHTYATAGQHDIVITGTIVGVQTGTTDRDKILEIKEFGPLALTNYFKSFRNCKNMIVTAMDAPDLSGCVGPGQCFEGCTALTGLPGAVHWNLAGKTNIYAMFKNCPNFDADLSSWDVSSVTNFLELLEGGQLSTANYDKILISWAGQGVSNEPIHFGSSQYSAAGATARQTLIDNGCTITDGGLAS